jgi:hypothetical protein
MHPTHLRSNLPLSGSLRLFEAAGLRPIASRLVWQPIVLERRADAPAKFSVLERIGIAVAQAVLAAARIANQPHLLVMGLYFWLEQRRLRAMWEKDQL